MPNLLLQKFPAPEFTATAKVTFTGRVNQDRTGLIVIGADYAYVGLTKTASGIEVAQIICEDAEHGAAEREFQPTPLRGDTFYLRVTVAKMPSRDSATVLAASSSCPLASHLRRAGRWIGAKTGLFALGTAPVSEYGYADYDWFRVE